MLAQFHVDKGAAKNSSPKVDQATNPRVEARSIEETDIDLRESAESNANFGGSSNESCNNTWKGCSASDGWSLDEGYDADDVLDHSNNAEVLPVAAASKTDISEALASNSIREFVWRHSRSWI